jgi:uncharacterized membrane protein (UPF0182 family)
VSGFFDDEPEAVHRRPVSTGPSPRSRALVITALVVIAFFFLLSSFTGVWTDRMWFNSVHYGGVFSKILGTKVLLFVLFGALFGGFVFANIMAAYRSRPLFRPTSPEQANLDRYRDVVEPLRKWIAIGISVVLGLFAGGSAAGEWRSYLMWRHHQPFGVKDPYFHKDVGFFVFQLPWLHYIVNVALTATVLGLLAAILVHYLFGGIRLQAKGDKLTGAAQVQLSVLMGLFVLFKAVDYWLDRFDLTIDQGRRFTGINYTASHAQLPAKNILMFIALICAVLFFANILRRTWMLPTVGLGLLVLSAILLGVLWPGIVYQFQVRPSEPDKEAPYLANNIAATRSAFGVPDVKTEDYAAATDPKIGSDVQDLPGVRLIDPARMSQAFEQLQQVKSYYSVSNVLDVDRYDVDGKSRDIVLGARELDQSGLVPEQRNWANLHTVYTHGYGVIAAFGNNRDRNDNQLPASDDNPAWAARGLTATTPLVETDYERRIYFGEKSPKYSIVGKAPGGKDVELNVPDDAKLETTTYDGADGVPVGGMFNKLLYAMKFGDANIVLSSRVHSDSKILYVRNPRQRVEKVAPWLTVDQDPYPAIVGGKVLWILDGYTSTDRYPNSERKSLSDMTSDALAPTTSYVTLPTDQVNYMRNSVKITVDAYDGTVKLYQWDDQDPILKVWEDIFPGTVLPKTDMPTGLADHLRYPEDLFKAQRFMLAQYHVTDPQTFYKGTDRWDVPQDPADAQDKQPPYRLSVQMPTSDEAAASPVFSLTSVYVPTKRSNLVGYIAVDSDATSTDYGKIRILRLPDNAEQVLGPSQIANKFAADEKIQNKLLGIKQNSQVVYGNLLTLPIGGGLLYVQPVYALKTSGEGAYPVLQFVLASFGKNAGFGSTLKEAVANVLGVDTPVTTPPNPNPNPPSTQVPGTVLDLLTKISDKQDQAEQALRNGDFARYGKLQQQIRNLIDQAVAEASKTPAKGTKKSG